jgi:hypothetical protein
MLALITVLIVKTFLQSNNWPLQSNAGQSFAGISTVLSTLALCAVLYTCSLQYRQIRTGQIQAQRSAQLDLLKIAFDHVGFARVLGFAGSTQSDFISWKQVVYRNLSSCISKWHSELMNYLHWDYVELFR